MPFWESSIFWGIAGIVAGIIVATFFFLIGQNKKLLEYQVITANLVTKDITNIPGISIMLDGEPLEDLVSTTIKFTNSGNQTIVPDDFATLEPLGATVTGQFLSAKHGYQVSCDNPNSCPYIKIINDNTANIDFDFLKPKQSFTITLWHSGILSVLGELKAGRRRKYREVYSTSKSLRFSLGLLSIVNIYMIFMFLLAILHEDYPSSWTNIDYSSPMVLFALTTAVILMLMFWIVPILLDDIKQNHTR